ncbi:hypothetical protein V8E54_003145 [Elaphomyces granulatus]
MDNNGASGPKSSYPSCCEVASMKIQELNGVIQESEGRIRELEGRIQELEGRNEAKAGDMIHARMQTQQFENGGVEKDLEIDREASAGDMLHTTMQIPDLLTIK